MRTYKLQVQIQVSDNWIADGFNPETKEWKESIEQSIVDLLPYAREEEFKASITGVTPPKFTIGDLEKLGLI